MSKRLQDALLWGVIFLAGCAMALGIMPVKVYGQEKDKSQWAQSPNKQWYESQEMTDEARKRLMTSYKSCCDAGDHFRTRFRVLEDGSKYGQETYEYWKDGVWKKVPPDIIQRKPTPDGQPVLFINKYNGVELCFIIDKEGI